VTRFWVGNGGNWSDNTNHWSASSGGAPGATLPTTADDVVFDANSFSSSAQTVDYDVSPNCKDFTTTAVTNVPTISASTTDKTLTIAGAVALAAPAACVMSTGQAVKVAFNSAGTHTLNPNGNWWKHAGSTESKFTGGGTWTFTSSPISASSQRVYVEAGTLNLGANTFLWRQLYDAYNGGGTPGTVVVNMNSATITLRDAISFPLAGSTVNPGTAAITFDCDIDFIIIDFTGKTITFPSVTFLQGTNTGEMMQMTGTITFTALTLEGGSGAYPMSAYGAVVTVGALTVTGGGVSTRAEVTGAFAASAVLNANSLYLHDTTLTGVTPGIAGANSVLGANVSGWVSSIRSGMPSVASIPLIPSIGSR